MSLTQRTNLLELLIKSKVEWSTISFVFVFVFAIKTGSLSHQQNNAISEQTSFGLVGQEKGREGTISKWSTMFRTRQAGNPKCTKLDF